MNMKFNFKKILLTMFITFICFCTNTKVLAKIEQHWCYYLGEDLAIHFDYYTANYAIEINAAFSCTQPYNIFSLDENCAIGKVYFVNLGGTSDDIGKQVVSYVHGHNENKVCIVPPYYSGGAGEAVTGKKGCPPYILARKCSIKQVYAIDEINAICASEGENLNFERFKEKLQARDSSCIVAWGRNVTEEEYSGSIGSDINVGFDDKELDCKCSEENPDNCLITPEIQDMIDEILMYPRIIVPIILILTGIYNFAKAAFANKEDEMKKYQKKFFKQLLIGVLVFLVPTLINIIIDLSQYVWDGLKTCSI